MKWLGRAWAAAENRFMRALKLALAVCLAVLVLAMLFWLAEAPPQADPPLAAAGVSPDVADGTIRIGIVPERDIFRQRERYRALAQYVESRLGRPVEVHTGVSYAAVLEDLRQGTVDAAFLGALATVLACDRLGARPVVRPIHPRSPRGYRGVIVVPDSSPLREVKDLAGRRLAMVRTTYAGHLFPIAELLRHGLWGSGDQPEPIWVGTHDEVLRDLAAGHVDAGAVKDLRLADYQQRHPELKLRWLATSDYVPDNALVLGGLASPEIAGELPRVLLAMSDSEGGRDMLARFGAERFVPCAIEDYGALFDIVEQIGDDWPATQLEAPPPARPAARPASGGQPRGGH